MAFILILNRSSSGGVVTRLAPGQCDMMFVYSGTNLMTCSGNYSWTSTTISPVSQNPFVPFVPIGINNLIPCNN